MVNVIECTICHRYFSTLPSLKEHTISTHNQSELSLTFPTKHLSICDINCNKDLFTDVDHLSDNNILQSYQFSDLFYKCKSQSNNVPDLLKSELIVVKERKDFWKLSVKTYLKVH